MRVKRSFEYARWIITLSSPNMMSLPSVRSSASTSSAGRKRMVVPLAVDTLQNSQG